MAVSPSSLVKKTLVCGSAETTMDGNCLTSCCRGKSLSIDPTAVKPEATGTSSPRLAGGNFPGPCVQPMAIGFVSLSQTEFVPPWGDIPTPGVLLPGEDLSQVAPSIGGAQDPVDLSGGVESMGVSLHPGIQALPLRNPGCLDASRRTGRLH